MSDALKHECGLAVVRLKHPLAYYHQKYGSVLWGFNKLYLLMGKMHNRGQDGAGLASIKLHTPAGQPYLAWERIIEPSPPWQVLFKTIDQQLQRTLRDEPDLLSDPERFQLRFPYGGELLMGHLRYATHGSLAVDNCHPVVRMNSWKTRTLVMAGNFNLTNVDQLIDKLVDLGQHPQHGTDTVTVLERVGHFLDRAVQEAFERYKAEGLPNATISEQIADTLDLQAVLARSARSWDGGYAMGGLLGHGDCFVARDPNGIRPCFWYEDDELVVAASERPAIATAFNVPIEAIAEIPPAHALLVKRSGHTQIAQVTEPAERRSCSFERIYFSRGTDRDIYRERIHLGRLVAEPILQAVGYDLDRTVFSYIPNTSQSAFWGLLKEVEDYLSRQKAEVIAALPPAEASPEAIHAILKRRVRVEQVINKDTKLRTFIAGDASRDDMAAHVYDITYGTLKAGADNLVCLDDSIVRGTTLKLSILKMLARLGPKTIVIASSAPQIRYPDCYGIDMSQIERLVAFQAAVTLLGRTGQADLLAQTYNRIQEAEARGELELENHVKAIYAPFTEQQIADEIARMLHTPGLGCELKIVYLPLARLPEALPDHRGDWYFSGNYPTPGGNRVVNRAFCNYIEGRNERAY